MNAKTWFESACDDDSFALITGASSGIGYEYLRAFALLGRRCIATSHDQLELAQAAQQVREEFRVDIVEVVADLSNDAGITSLLNACEPYDIAVLVNNAGFGVKGEFITHPAELYRELVCLNALAPTLICRHLVPKMIQAGRGLVLHVASINACTPLAYNAVYTATKAYLLYYAYALSYELGNTPLHFQVVLPGTTKTPFHNRQGAVPQAMYMEPHVVVQRSLDHVNRLLSISNRMDRFLFPFVSALPLWLRVRVGTAILKHRLKLVDK